MKNDKIKKYNLKLLGIILLLLCVGLITGPIIINNDVSEVEECVAEPIVYEWSEGIRILEFWIDWNESNHASPNKLNYNKTYRLFLIEGHMYASELDVDEEPDGLIYDVRFVGFYDHGEIDLQI